LLCAITHAATFTVSVELVANQRQHYASYPLPPFINAELETEYKALLLLIFLTSTSENSDVETLLSQLLVFNAV